MKSSFGKSFGLFISLLFLILFIKPSKSAILTHKIHPFDSVRSENINGVWVIVYSVSPHETLYSIARRYNINPKTLISFNHNITSLSTGQEILIPRNTAVPNNSPSRPNGFVPSSTITVIKGETLYSIAHSHGFTAEEIQKANHLPDFSLKLGQKLYIPAYNPETNNKPVITPSTSPENSANKPIEKPNSSLLPIPANGLYKVGSGETIYSIGFKYGVGVEEIRSLNNILNNDIKVGQTLRLRSNVALPENTALPTQPSAPLPNNNPSNSEKRNPVALPTDISKPETTTTHNPAFIPSSEPHRSRNIPRAFKEEGMGIWIDNTDLNQAKSVALHRLAPVGTVIKVTNPMTKKSIFVKVVGSFPETAETKNAVLVISKSAALLIGAIDPHFRVELSYAY